MVIMHVDANSAYLSWTAAALLEKGCPLDIRTVPSVISGNPESRHGIILAKSTPAKKFNIQTGESLYSAKQKCKNLLVFPPAYDQYLLCSNEMYKILQEYTPIIQRYSVDECFIDMTNSKFISEKHVETAYEIKDRIKRELGFSVNVGLSNNKLLAKMAGELKKPDMVHTLWPEEIRDKLWGLPVEELFMVGRATAKKLKKINIKTIGELAKMEPEHLKAIFKSHGLLIWNYANGIDNSPVILNEQIIQKGIGNSTTTAYDLITFHDIQMVLLALTERTAMRLRKLGTKASLIRIQVKTDSFISYSHQIQLNYFIDSTSDIFHYGCLLIKEVWRKEPLRHIGITVSNFGNEDTLQLSLLDSRPVNSVRNSTLDKTIDQIRSKYGNLSIQRGCFVNGSVDSIQGGVNDGDYIMMGGYNS